MLFSSTGKFSGWNKGYETEKNKGVMVIDADLIIIGGGASGLMAAITAAEHGAGVLLLEQQEKTGKKLSATGNGRCNFTNADMKPEYYFQGCGDHFAEYALQAFPPERALAFFEESGIAAMQKNGYYYPLSGQAELVREALLFRFLHGRRQGGEKENKTSVVRKCKCSCRVADISKRQGIFHVMLEDGYVYTADAVLLACGSPAAPQLGGSFSGIQLAGKLGHTIIPVLPALCGLKASYPGWERAAGVRILAGISMEAINASGRTVMGRQYGELQMTVYGISGIPVFQLSGRAVRCLEQKERVNAVIDFLPELPSVCRFLQKQKKAYPQKPILMVLSGILPEKLASLMLMSVFGKQKKNRQETAQVQTVEDRQLEELAQKIKKFEIPMIGSAGFQHAQAASGGVNTREIYPETMESKLVPGLYFSGEIIDVDGICGGYNLHWAWASGYLAGKAAADACFCRN